MNFKILYSDCRTDRLRLISDEHNLLDKKWKFLCLLGAISVGCTTHKPLGENSDLNQVRSCQFLSEKSISVIAPASGTSIGNIKSLEAKMKIDIMSLISDEIPYNANTDEKRFAALKNAIYNPKTDIIWALRGGYGSARLIDRLSRLPKPSKQKILIGYSDITALHLFFSQKWGWKTIHGPFCLELLNSSKDAANLKIIADIVTDKMESLSVNDLSPMNDAAYSSKLIKGPISGGNLTIIQNSLGTDWQIQADGKILLIEDVGVGGYEVDRSLLHLKQAGVFDNVKAVVLGDFSECAKDAHVNFALKRFAQESSIPVFKTNKFGHGKHNFAFVYSSFAEIKFSKEKNEFSMKMKVR